MEFLPDPYHIWWPIAVKFEGTRGGQRVESTVLSVCRDPKCGTYGTRRVSGHYDLVQIQQLTLCTEAAELAIMPDPGATRKRGACPMTDVFLPRGEA